MENTFRDMVESYEKSEHFSFQLCPDKYVGRVGDISCKNEYARTDNVFDAECGVLLHEIPSHLMVLILESPHIQEFTGKNAPCPANGTTGRNIRNRTLAIFGDAYKNHHLILMNAIPFQCSLGGKNRKIRDNVFSMLWQKELLGEPFFKRRLAPFKDAFIVNACTQMNGLKDHVQNAILEVTGRDVLQLDHPCVQWNANYRKQKERFDAWSGK